ncbi:MAG TPA: NADH-quinone oxidoreductase subunit NuoE [Actinomycetota bacterium]|nr:NADH-quinone oxidoreductase subunit NuoE [Actinomycetota bacterium]
MPLTEPTLARVEELIARYPQRRSVLLPLLFLIQAEDGYVSPAGVAQVAELLGLTKAEVGAVATFYTMFRRRPVGRYLVSVCRTLSCELRGSREIAAAVAERLDVPLGGTDATGMVTVEEVECLAACDGAPVLQVNTENYERITREQALELVERLLAGELPPPTLAGDGAVTEPSTAALHWRLAGLGEPPPELAGRKPDEVTEVPAAFPAQPPAPSLTEDPTTRPVEELRTGVDHGGTTPEAGEAEPPSAPKPGEDGEPAPVDAGRHAAGQDPKGREAEAPQPESAEPDQAMDEAAEQAGPHQREQPGGEAQ